MKIIFYILTLILPTIILSCKQNNTQKTIIDIDTIDLGDTNKVLSSLDTTGQGIPIFYNMYLSVELSSLFQTAGAVFSKDILNPPEKKSDYITSYKKAMNLGVYAVDLSYARAFEQNEVAGKYFNSMQELSEQLGIPQEFFNKTSERLEMNLSNKDSLIAIANEVYYGTENYLKENERFSTASVIIMAGWVEAVYIGTHVAIESRNPDIIERLIDQKYSLNNLLLMLKEYESNQIINEYISDLKKVSETFNTLEVQVPVDFNPESKNSQKLIDEWLKNISELQNAIKGLRKEIIS